MDANEASVRRVTVVVLGLLVALILVLVVDLVANGRPVAEAGKFLAAGLILIAVVGGMSLAAVRRRE